MIRTTALPLTLSEAEFQRTVIDYALLRSWRVVHYRPARTLHGYRTALTGHPGAPDLLLARDGCVLCVELKRHTGRLTKPPDPFLCTTRPRLNAAPRPCTCAPASTRRMPVSCWKHSHS